MAVRTEQTPIILIVDDDSEIRYSLSRVLQSTGCRLESASSGEEGLEKAREHQPHVIFLDNRMEGMSGIETLQHLRSVSPSSLTILMTAFGTTQAAIEAMKYGALDYVVKPFDKKKVLSLTEKALRAHSDLVRSSTRQVSVDPDDLKEGIVGSSEAMQAVFKTIGQVATSDVTVMITGESGTGKELVARSIYRHSLRAAGPFMAVNCAAIPENLIESELFGHEKGAFTGATQQRIGRFELCDGGTIFLDEIGDMGPATQTKILRALQEGEIQRVGGEAIIKVDVRVIAATNKPLESMVEEKSFREDLFYRLNVVRIHLPPLRERMEDIPALADFLLQRVTKDIKGDPAAISDEALECLRRYPWPGNVRELENALRRSVVVARGRRVLVKDLPGEIIRHPEVKVFVEAGGEVRSDSNTVPAESVSEEEPGDSGAIGGGRESPSEILAGTENGLDSSLPVLGRKEVFDLLYKTLRQEIEEDLLGAIEQEMIERVLVETKGNQVKASTLLGITRATLRKRIEAKRGT